MVRNHSVFVSLMPCEQVYESRSGHRDIRRGGEHASRDFAFDVFVDEIGLLGSRVGVTRYVAAIMF
jgi:hypothetical protein